MSIHPYPTKSQAFFASVAEKVVHHRFKVLLGIAAITLFLGSHLINVRVNNANDNFFIQNDPALKAYRDFQKEFGSDEFVLILLEGESLFTPEAHAAVSQFVRELKELRYQDKPAFKEVSSPFNVPIIRGDMGMLEVTTLFDPNEKPTEVMLKEAQQKLIKSRLYRNILVNEPGDAIAIAGILTLFVGDNNFAHFVANETENIMKKNNMMKWNTQLVGSPIIKKQLDDATAQESQVYGVAAIVIAILALVFLFRNTAQVAAATSVVLLAVIWTVGLMGLLGVEMSLVSIILPLAVIVTGLGCSIHVVNEFRALRKRFLQRPVAAIEALSITGMPCFLTALTTGIGFFSMVVAPVAPMQDLGLFCGIGVLFCFVLAITLIPAVLSLGKDSEDYQRLTIPPSGHDRVKMVSVSDRFYNALAKRIVGHPKKVALGFIGLALLASLGIQNIHVESNFLHAFRSHHPFRQAVEKVDRKLGGTHGIEVLVKSEKPGGIFNIGFIQKLSELEDWLHAEQSGMVGASLSVVDLLKELNFALIGERKLPDTTEAVHQLILLYESGGGDLKLFTDNKNQIARLSVRARAEGTQKALALEKALLEKADTLFKKNKEGEGQLWITGTHPLFVHLADYVLKSQVRAFSTAAIIIAFLMMFLLRSAALGLAVMLPNLLPIFATYGLMGWMGIPLDWLTAVIAVVALGVAVDGTIHIGNRFREARLSGDDAQMAARYVMVSIGKALVITGTVLCAGFAVVAPSEMASLSRFGILTATCFFFAMVADLILTPAVLAWLNPGDINKKG
ncbi:MAG: hypothetical protein CMH56_15310 [Myxococcales bacterium]|nr:hypothetical protein [Myxococcales bacterium]|tara:strand:+ start:3619 stop:5991 length:2373 start_codon:yes stop_codon:yes gene_type:complete